MTLRLVIIADDLTGALDTSTPFVEQGLRVVVAIWPEALAEALAQNPDVVAVNTASRALSGDEAVARLIDVVAAVRSATPAIVFKKIDSRLKGNVAAESTALAQALGRGRIVVAPAIPDQQRFTVAGAVTGRGVETPLPIAPLFAGSPLDITVHDAGSDADLDRVVDDTDWSEAIAVGARGLGSAFARSLARSDAGARTARKSFRSTDKTLFAFGSRDPITDAQIEHLCASGAIASQIHADAGDFQTSPPVRLPAVLRCTGTLSEPAERVAKRFATGVAETALRTIPDMLMMGGGDTALAILTELGVSILVPHGEIEAGIPWFEITDRKGRTFACAVKSGGFGGVDSLLNLLPDHSGMTRPQGMRRDGHG